LGKSGWRHYWLLHCQGFFGPLYAERVRTVHEYDESSDRKAEVTRTDLSIADGIHDVEQVEGQEQGNDARLPAEREKHAKDEFEDCVEEYQYGRAQMR